MPAKPVSIGALSFRRKGDATNFFRNMLYRYELGDKVTVHDAKILAELVAQHPEASMKIGCGILSFSVRSADFGTRCFYVNRTDGTSEKFSFLVCY